MAIRIATLVAADFGESALMHGLGKQLKHFELIPLLGEGAQPSPFGEDKVRSAVEKSDLVIAAQSEYCGMEVLAAQEAQRLNKPLALVAMGYGSWGAEAFAPVRAHARLLFVVDDEEARLASPLYPNAAILAIGNPEWEEWSTPQRSRTEVRALLGVKPEEKCVLVAGEKEMTINFPLGVCIIEALASLPHPEQYAVIFTVHPGHAAYPGRDSGIGLRGLYQGLVEYSPKVKVCVSCKADPFGIGTTDMVVGADVVVGTNSMVQVQAALLRIPAIGIFFRGAFRGKNLPVAHQGWWPPADRGAVAAVYDMSSQKTANLIDSLLTRGGFEGMRAAQERYFKPLSRADIYATMRAELEKL